MKEVTLNQVSQVIALLKQKRESHQRLKELLSSGLLADLLDQSIRPGEVDRDQFRKIIGFGAFIETYTTDVDYDFPFERGMQEAGLSHHFGDVGLERLKNVFNAPNMLGERASGIVTLDLKVVSFRDKDSCLSTEALEALDNLGMRAAITPELIAFAIAHKGAIVQGADHLIALGSEYSFGGEEQVLKINCHSTTPYLMCTGTIHCSCRFLAVNKS